MGLIPGQVDQLHLDDVGHNKVTKPGDLPAIKIEEAHEKTQMASTKPKALQLESKARAPDAQSEAVLRPHTGLSLDMALTQIAVALASITVLTRKRWLYVGDPSPAAVSISVAVSGWL